MFSGRFWNGVHTPNWGIRCIFGKSLCVILRTVSLDGSKAHIADRRACVARSRPPGVYRTSVLTIMGVHYKYTVPPLPSVARKTEFYLQDPAPYVNSSPSYSRVYLTSIEGTPYPVILHAP